jgi:hypothetical protein
MAGNQRKRLSPPCEAVVVRTTQQSGGPFAEQTQHLQTPMIIQRGSSHRARLFKYITFYFTRELTSVSTGEDRGARKTGVEQREQAGKVDVPE